jgi:hypothetical protein
VAETEPQEPANSPNWQKIWRELNITLAIVAAIIAIFFAGNLSFKGPGVELSVSSAEKGIITSLYWAYGTAKRQIEKDGTLNNSILWADCQDGDIAIGGSCVLSETKGQNPQLYLQNLGPSANRWHCKWSDNLLFTVNDHRTDAAALCARIKKQ